MNKKREKLMNVYVVYRLDVARELISRGHILMKTEPNKKNPKLSVFIFDTNSIFFYDLENIIESKKRK